MRTRLTKKQYVMLEKMSRGWELIHIDTKPVEKDEYYPWHWFHKATGTKENIHKYSRRTFNSLLKRQMIAPHSGLTIVGGNPVQDVLFTVYLPTVYGQTMFARVFLRPLAKLTQTEMDAIVVLDSEIRDLSYYKWEQAGRPNGQNDYFWLEAEKELCTVNGLAKLLSATEQTK